MTTNPMELISMVESLPVDIKTILVQEILDSLPPSQKEIDELWKVEVERRIEEAEPGKLWQRVISPVVVVGGLRVPLGVANPPRPLNALSTI